MQPEVCAVCITADRPELTRKAVTCFEAQTYQAKRLVIYDTSKAAGEIVRYRGHFQHVVVGGSHQTIGELRNAANAFAREDEVIIHFDSDDHSHANRIAEQVALLQSSGADVVGYNCVPFLRDDKEAWLYTNKDPRYAVGASFTYWRHVWKRKPFEATSQGEDCRFLTGLNSVGVSAFPAPSGDPRMICRIHNGNTSTAYRLDLMRAVEKQGGEWRQEPALDELLRTTVNA